MNHQVVINLSNRHIHLSQADVEVLFGKGHQLTHFKDLKQPGQFACEEIVTVVGDKGQIANVRVLGPARPETQLEVLQSDLLKLTKTAVPVRESGKLAESAGFELVGPNGRVKKASGMIVAKRHIHLDPESAAKMGLVDTQVVKLRAGIPGREVIFENVVARVNAAYALEAHLDYDEGNACGIANGTMGEIIK